MLECTWFTKEQAASVAAAAPTSTRLSEILSNAIRSAPTAGPMDAVALIAFKDDAVAGWIWFTYGFITDNGHPIRVAAAQNLFTFPEFRGCGAGKNLIVESLNIGMPCVYSGISGQAMPLYQKLGFTFLDMCPIYKLPLSFPGLLRNWRATYYESRDPGFGSVIGSFINQYRVRVQALGRRPDNWHVVGAEKAGTEFARISAHRARRFQVPWPTESYRVSLNGKTVNQNTVVLTAPSAAHHNSRFVSIYRRDAEVRIPLTGRALRFIDGHVNEIYPPVDDLASAIGIICTLAREGRRLGLGSLSIYGMTEAIREACKGLGLNIQGEKRFAIKPGGLEDSLAAELTKNENWWCRAMNEEQIEEAAYVPALVPTTAAEERTR